MVFKVKQKNVNEYIYFCIPVKWDTPTFNVGGFDGGFFKVAEINFTNKSGYTEPYSIWRSDNHSLGSQSVTVKQVIINGYTFNQ